MQSYGVHRGCTCSCHTTLSWESYLGSCYLLNYQPLLSCGSNFLSKIERETSPRASITSYLKVNVRPNLDNQKWLWDSTQSKLNFLSKNECKTSPQASITFYPKVNVRSRLDIRMWGFPWRKHNFLSKS